LIETPSGQMPVEYLAEGDEVRTLLGAAGRIVWAGSREVDCVRHPKPETVWPVRICRDAFGDNLPARDLYVSPDHALYVQDVLIPAKHLVNGTTVCQIRVDRLTYYHIELAHHDLVLAEGLPAETYLDTDDRANFANGGPVMRLHPDFSGSHRDTLTIREAFGCAPLVVIGAEVDAARAALNARASAVLSARVAA